MYENYFSEYTNLNFNEYIEVQTAYLWNVYTSSLGTWESQVHSFLALVSLIKKKKKRGQTSIQREGTNIFLVTFTVPDSSHLNHTVMLSS